MAADDDRPGAPARENALCANKLLLRHADVFPKALDEWTTVFSADGQVAGAAQHRARNNRKVSQRIRDGAGSREVSAVSDRSVPRRGERHTKLLQEDDQKQTALLMLLHEKSDSMSEGPPPTWFLQPARKVVGERQEECQH